MAKQWVVGKHATAQRLLKHAESQYDTSFSLQYAIRPWATTPGVNRISGCEGVIWKAHWMIRGGELRPADPWRRICEFNDTADFVIHLELTSYSVTASFSALDAVDSIGTRLVPSLTRLWNRRL